MAPRDEAALLGRAQALAALDRRAGAADAYDALAEVRVSSGKLSDAVDAARRGLEMAEGRERRRTLERLIKRLRASEPDEPGRVALERALRVLDGEAVPSAPNVRAPAAAHGPKAPAHRGDPGALVPAPRRGSAPDVATEPVVADAEADADAGAPDAGAADAPAAVAAEPAPVPVRRPLDRDLPPEAMIADLEARARDAADAGTPGPALEAHLDLAAAYRRDGHVDAALDACYAALTFDPDGFGLHLALVELYDEAGWSAAALDKLALTERLAVLDDDAEALAMVAAARADLD
jgi:tetratricopeptide (TPR) repeat protein